MTYAVTVATHFPHQTLRCEILLTNDPLEASAAFCRAIVEHTGSPVPMTIEHTQYGRRRSLAELPACAS